MAVMQKKRSLAWLRFFNFHIHSGHKPWVFEF